jgi:hypothetical protein
MTQSPLIIGREENNPFKHCEQYASRKEHNDSELDAFRQISSRSRKPEKIAATLNRQPDGGCADYGFAQSLRRRSMIDKKKLMLTAMLMVISLSAPALARSNGCDSRDGYGVNSDENGIQHDVCPPFRSVRHHGRALYDKAPSNWTARDPNSAAATGGGSLGYNQMLLID